MAPKRPTKSPASPTPAPKPMAGGGAGASPRQTMGSPAAQPAMKRKVEPSMAAGKTTMPSAVKSPKAT